MLAVDDWVTASVDPMAAVYCAECSIQLATLCSKNIKLKKKWYKWQAEHKFAQKPCVY